jgi:hypothetical protein
MEMTVDLSESIVERTKIAAARRRATSKISLLRAWKLFCVGKSPPRLLRMPLPDFAKAITSAVSHLHAIKTMPAERFLDTNILLY